MPRSCLLSCYKALLSHDMSGHRARSLDAVFAIASVSLAGGDAEVSENFRPAVAHVLEGSVVLGQDEARMDKAKARSVLDAGKRERDDGIEPRSVADICLVATFPGIGEAFVRHNLEHLAVNGAV